MCGIIGCIGSQEVVPLLISGLKKLEYRGYDSAGLCIQTKDKLTMLKKRGNVAELANFNGLQEIKGSCGIAHTRWATHGEPNELNAHPHFDCKKDIAIVHNGIIENYHLLKEILQKEGHKIVSHTDSEILAHLIEKFYSGDLEKAVMRALKLVEGAFGIAAIHKKEERIVVARRGSPLILGIGKGELFVTSDVSAIAQHTKKVIYLDDNQISTITRKGYIIKDLDGKEILNSEIHELQWDISQIEKGGYKHFMLKEIFEQPNAIQNALRGRIKDDKVQLTVNIDFDSMKKIYIVACGTSWHSSLIGKYIIEKLAGIPVEVDYASEFRYRNPIIDKGDLVIAVSQSGETADTLAALREAKAKHAQTLGIINVVGSTIAREVDSWIYLQAGPEIGVASTKAFTSQLVALTLFALFIQQKKGFVPDKDILKGLEHLPQDVKTILQKADDIKKIAKYYQDNKNMLYLGRGIQYPVALEGALKLKEISYIHAEGYPAAEMKHGPIALVDENMPVLFIAPQDATYEKIVSNMEEIKARKGRIIALVNSEDEKIKKLVENVFVVPKVKEELSPIINVLPLQLLAYYIADLRGIDVDKPRNLAKSVTVE